MMSKGGDIEMNEEKRARINAEARARYFMGKAREEGVEVIDGVKCPACGMPVGVKAGGTGFVRGCMNSRCKSWIGRATECLATSETAKADCLQWAAEAAPEAPRPESGADTSDGHASKRPRRKAARKEEATPRESREEEATGASFELVLDGVRYRCVPDEEGCEGCAFFFEFGARMLCVANASDDFGAARTLCGELQGQWRKLDG